MIVATLALWLAMPARAQVDVGTGIGPEAFSYTERAARQPVPILPLALAASLAFDSTTWAAVQVSSVPAQDLTALIKKGYYKLELLQAVLLAAKAKVPLREIVEAHDKGKSLRELATARNVDFDPLYEEALKLDERLVDRLLPSVMTVSVLEKEPPAAPPPASPQRRKP